MVATISALELKKLYEIDDHLWLEKTIELLKEKNFEQLDLANLIEELESLSRKDKAKVSSLLEQIIRHLLLCQYWEQEKENNLYHWQAEIVGFRSQIERLLTTNLSNHLELELDNIYQSALRFVNQKTAHTVKFPDICPYSLEQLLDQDYFF
jgi:hypothetical protein